ncbi:MAG: pyrimidine 5'-nucleotidase [Rhodospirillaceae bacterium]|nr:pyrimidine 5'-nucleotidase [Rhodospirillaceae bacterium]
MASRFPPDAAVSAPALDHVEAWVFDLDNTLYPAECDLFSQVDVRIGQFIADRFGISYDEARRLQKNHFRRYGTTMRGLMTETGCDPHEFLAYVHAIDHSPVQRDVRLDAALAALPGPKYVFTNASVPHSEKVLARLGIAHHFADIFDIVAAEFDPKPHDAFYDRFFARHGLPWATACLFEDMAKNLAPAHARGMTTVLIETDNDYSMTGHDGPYIQHRTRDLAGWLEGVAAARKTA